MGEGSCLGHTVGPQVRELSLSELLARATKTRSWPRQSLLLRTLSSSLQKANSCLSFKLQSWYLLLNAAHLAPSLPQPLRAVQGSIQLSPFPTCLGTRPQAPCYLTLSQQPPHERGIVIIPFCR